MPRSFPASPAPGRAIGAALAALLLLSGCSATSTFDAGDHRLKVVASTGIIADLAKNVAGNRAEVLPLVPEGADPHSYEPTLRDVRNIAYADVAFTNHLLLEERWMPTSAREPRIFPWPKRVKSTGRTSCRCWRI